MTNDLVRALSELKEKEALRIVEERLNSGENPLILLEDATHAMEIVGKRFAEKEYFIPDLVYSGELLREITKRVTPKLTSPGHKKRLGKVLLGTVAGDIHDIGKDIAAFMLDVNGFEVHDLGVDVPPGTFVEKIKEVNPEIVGMSGLLTVAFNSMKATVDAIQAAGLRDHVKIMIGGSQVDEQIRKYSGADAYCLDAMSGVFRAKEWVGEK